MKNIDRVSLHSCKLSIWEKESVVCCSYDERYVRQFNIKKIHCYVDRRPNNRGSSLLLEEMIQKCWGIKAEARMTSWRALYCWFPLWKWHWFRGLQQPLICCIMVCGRPLWHAYVSCIHGWWNAFVWWRCMDDIIITTKLVSMCTLL